MSTEEPEDLLTEDFGTDDDDYGEVNDRSEAEGDRHLTTTDEPGRAHENTVEPTRVFPTTVEPARVSTTIAEPPRVFPTTAELPRVFPTLAEPARVQSTTTEPPRIDPVSEPSLPNASEYDFRRPTLIFQEKLDTLFDTTSSNDVVARSRGKALAQRLIRPRLQYYNTYQLGPLSQFQRSDVELCINRTLEEGLVGKRYCSSTGSAMTGALAEVIRDRLLEFRYDRYKFVVVVHLGPKARQGIEIGSMCLWDPGLDHGVYGTFESYHVFASASVYGLYFN